MSPRAANIVIGVILVVVILASILGALFLTSAAAANAFVGGCLALWLVALLVWFKWA